MKTILLLYMSLFITTVYAEGPSTLEELLELVKKERSHEKEEYKERELRFKNAHDEQKKILNDALTQLKTEETRSEHLKIEYERNKLEILRQTNLLNQKMGSLSELDGVVRQISGDLDAIIDSSLVSTQKPNRDDILDQLSDRKEFPSLQELEDIWILAMDEIVESGRIVTFPGKIVTAIGDEIERNITRIGVFNAVSSGHFLRSLPGTGKFIEPGRQPGKLYQNMAQNLENADSGIHPFPIDPTKGAMLALLVQVPDLKNRIEQGGIVGYVILFIGIIGVLISLERFIVLITTLRKVQEQLKRKKSGPNPLGRIMQVYEDNPDIDTETLGLKLDEAILKELPKIQRGLGALALLATVAPLLGLLGTVTGIIETFQSITLYGTGDPRVMSGGISQALVTTVMGLLVAISLLLFHSFLLSKSNNLIQILDEKSTAFVALLAEKNRSGNHV